MDEAAAWALLRTLRRRPPGSSTPALPQPADPEARRVLDLFLPVVLGEEIAVAQLGQSLDGRIATVTGRSHYITGPEDIVRLHRLRALVDAVVVGVGTVAADDPRLTVREVEGENPVRVVLDPRGRIPGRARVLRDGAAPTLVLQGARAERPPRGKGFEVVTAMPGEASTGPAFHPAAVLDLLRRRGLRRVLVEGGGVTVSRFLQAGVLQRLHVTVAPLLIGSGRPAFTLDPVETLDRALRPRCRHFVLGNDLLFDLELAPDSPAASSPDSDPGDVPERGGEGRGAPGR